MVILCLDFWREIRRHVGLLYGMNDLNETMIAKAVSLLCRFVYHFNTGFGRRSMRLGRIYNKSWNTPPDLVSYHKNPVTPCYIDVGTKLFGLYLDENNNEEKAGEETMEN